MFWVSGITSSKRKFRACELAPRVKYLVGIQALYPEMVKNGGACHSHGGRQHGTGAGKGRLIAASIANHVLKATGAGQTQGSAPSHFGWRFRSIPPYPVPELRAGRTQIALRKCAVFDPNCAKIAKKISSAHHRTRTGTGTGTGACTNVVPVHQLY